MASEAEDESRLLIPRPDADESVHPRHPAYHHTEMTSAAARGALRWTIRQFTGMNVLLVFVPLGFAAERAKWYPVAVWTFNFLAIIPLSALVSRISDDLSDAWGNVIGALVNATFGNAVELIVGDPHPVSLSLDVSRVCFVCC